MMWKLQRDFDVLVLHDLQDRQALGSLTTIWSEFSDTWDNRLIEIFAIFEYIPMKSSDLAFEYSRQYSEITVY